jgi:hypothetical protein
VPVALLPSCVHTIAPAARTVVPNDSDAAVPMVPRPRPDVAARLPSLRPACASRSSPSLQSLQCRSVTCVALPRRLHLDMSWRWHPLVLRRCRVARCVGVASAPLHNTRHRRIGHIPLLMLCVVACACAVRACLPRVAIALLRRVCLCVGAVVRCTNTLSPLLLSADRVHVRLRSEHQDELLRLQVLTAVWAAL